MNITQNHIDEFVHDGLTLVDDVFTEEEIVATPPAPGAARSASAVA